MIISELKPKPDFLEKLHYKIYYTEIHNYFDNGWEEYQFGLKDKKNILPFDISVKYRKKILNEEVIEMEETDKEIFSLFKDLLKDEIKEDIIYSFKDLGSYSPNHIQENKFEKVEKVEKKIIPEMEIESLFEVNDLFITDFITDRFQIPFTFPLNDGSFKTLSKEEIIKESENLMKQLNDQDIQSTK